MLNHRLRRALRRVAILAGLVGLMATSTVPSALSSNENHCVYAVVDTLPNGEFVLTERVCFPTLAEALHYGSGGQIDLPADATFEDLEGVELDVRSPLGGNQTMGSATASHYFGINGSGTSATIFNIDCTNGGSWPVDPFYDNQIDSTRNACYKTRHYDHEGYSGWLQTTYTAGQLDNLFSSNRNKTNSITYKNT